MGCGDARVGAAGVLGVCCRRAGVVRGVGVCGVMVSFVVLGLGDVVPAGGLGECVVVMLWG